MELVNRRILHNDQSTLGLLYINSKPFCFVIEDEPRTKKVKGETRIPAGRYKLGLQMAETPLTIEYRKKFPWFKHHIELMDVPNFTGIYIHVGNYEHDTDGCQIIGLDATITPEGNFANMRSTSAFTALYQELYSLLAKGANIHYNIIDHDHETF